MKLIDKIAKKFNGHADCAFSKIAAIRFAEARGNEVTDGHYLIIVAEQGGEKHEFHLLIAAGNAAIGRYRKNTTQAFGQVTGQKLADVWRKPICETFDAGQIAIS